MPARNPSAKAISAASDVTKARRSLRGERTATWVAVVPDIPDRASSAKARSRADWNLSSGAFSRQRRISLSMAGEMFLVAVEISGGSSFRMAFIVSIEESPRNARCPPTISYRIAPKLKISERTSAVFPRTCSGDM